MKLCVAKKAAAALAMSLFIFSGETAFSQAAGLSQLKSLTSSSSSSYTSSSVSKSSSSLKSSSSSISNTPDAQLAMSVSSYPVTPGDIYTLAFAAGTSAVSYSISIDTTYKVRVANLGVINCRGLTYIELKNQVTGIVQKNYPMGGVQFVLMSPATFLVTVTGEVEKTEQRTAWGLTRLSSIMEEGLTSYASTRNVTVISEEGEEKNYDLFLADRKADLGQNPYLRPGDKVIVNRVNRKVTVKGAVERPGTYELSEGENLRELIDYYGGGLAPLADVSRMELQRTVTNASVSGEKIYLDSSSYKDNYALLCYDRVYVSSYKDLRPVVFVEGAVNSITQADENEEDVLDFGENSILMSDSKTMSTDEDLTSSNKIAFQFNEGEDYAFFVRRNKEMFSNVSDLENAYVMRGSEHIPLNVSELLYDETSKTKLEMKLNDTLRIPFRQNFVSVSGAVYSPGRYPYVPDRTYDYYVGLAGGFVKEKNKHDAVTITDIDGKKHKKAEIILPEMTIEAKANSGLYFFNQYATVLTTLLSAASVSISILVATGAM